MKKIGYADFMNDEFQFLSLEDEKICMQYWVDKNELTVDDYGRVFNEGGEYVADVRFETFEEGE